MDKINNFLKRNSKYKRYKKPLEAAGICAAARLVAGDRFEVISFRDGLLTCSVLSPAAATNLQMTSQNLIDNINQKIGHPAVKRVRFKIE